MKLNFRAEQGNGGMRLYAACENCNKRSVSFEKAYGKFHKEENVFMKSNSVCKIFLS